jgi:glycosyltransferase involved in cell wall biosynthesis
MKPTLSFYTNIPSPYNLDLFWALSTHFELQVIYYSKIESGRQWHIDTEHPQYQTTVLENNFVGRFIQRFKSEFHFSSGILRHCLKDTSNFVILGGNYFSPNTYIVLLISVFKKKKIYWFGEKLLPSFSFIQKTIKKILLKPLFYSCKGIFCVGKAAILSYQSFGYKGDCYNIPYSINTSNYNINTLNKTQLEIIKNQFNPSNKFVILTSGSLIQRKGIDIAIKSYLNLPIELKNKSVLWIIGDGPLRLELEALDDKTGEICFLGFINSKELPYYFNLATIFLFSSRYDGWAVVINEALSAGLPVVVSDQVTAAELITNEKNGFICESDNVAAFTAALEKILRGADLRLEISNNNYQLSQQWNSVAMALKVSKILLNV